MAEKSVGAGARRVAFVLGTSAGGTGTHVRMLAAGCAARGIAVSVYAPGETGTRFGFAQLPGVAFTPLEFGDRLRPADALAVLYLRRALRATSPPDVVHAHGLRAGALSVLALARARKRPALVVTVHNAPPAGDRVPAMIYRLLEYVVARGADRVLCVSSDLDKRMRAAGARRVGRAIVAAPAAPHQPPVPQRSPARPVVLAVGRLAPQKGFGTLLEAAASWRDMDPEPVLVIAGEGPLSAALRSSALSLGVAARFLGHRDDVPALLAGCAVFVLPSLWEGQPLVLQEALRAGVPVVASHVGGIPELVSDAALLVPPGDPAALASAVRSILLDPALAARLRDAAAKRAATLPTPDDAVAAALESYGILA
jgi:glycosyltransferase involved in cell wall biosynthesis